MSNQIVRATPATLKDVFNKRKGSIAAVAAKHLNPDRLLRVMLGCTLRNPTLQQCTPESVINAVMQAAELGLEAGSALGEAYLVPYKNNNKGGIYECQMIPGYRGLIALARRSGEIANLYAVAVHEKDAFTVRRGLNPDIEHETFVGEDAGHLVAVYAVARFKDGAFQFEVMSKAEVDKIRSRSRASNGGPWVTDYEEMAKKTVVKRLAKYLPLSIEFARAVSKDDYAESGQIDDDAIDVEDLSGHGDAPALDTPLQSTAAEIKEKLAPSKKAAKEPDATKEADAYLQTLQLTRDERAHLDSLEVPAESIVAGRDAGIDNSFDLLSFLTTGELPKKEGLGV
jgi:recombination protein RecT